MALPHPVLPINGHSHSPAPTPHGQHPPPSYIQTPNAQMQGYPQYAVQQPPPQAQSRPPQPTLNGVPTPSQARLQQQQQQQLNQQQRGVVPQSPHHPSPSPHLTHQGFPVNGQGGIHPQQYPHPPPGQQPAQMRQSQQVRPPQQHPGFQQHPGQPQPGLNGIAMQHNMEGEAFGMTRVASGVPMQQRQDSDTL